MRKVEGLILLLASLVAVGAAAGSAGAQVVAPGQTVLSLELTGVVDPFMANYVKGGIDEAERDGNAAVLFTIDTPGGLDSSMRTITKAILASRVPVICYTAPSGARAASAGAFIMLSCPINAMAPGTNIGAAHPVGVSGAIELDKVTNDAAAYIRSLADQWGRNADWAEDAVRNSVSIPAEEAVKIDVADLLAANTQELLTAVDGRSLHLADGTDVTVHTAGAVLENRSMGLGAAILHGLIDPNLAFLFFYLGLIMIIIEVLHPGISVPGLLGALMLVAAFVSFGFLPVQLGGVVLLIVSAAFFLAELKHPGIGLPTVGGVITLIAGGLLLFNSAVPNARVSPWLLTGVALGIVAFFVVVVRVVVAARSIPKAAGIEGLVGQEGAALDDLAPGGRGLGGGEGVGEGEGPEWGRGRVRAGKETWSAESAGPYIPAGSTVRVVRVEGLRLIVEPVIPQVTPQTAGGGAEIAVSETAAPSGGGREGE
jgi:membrane-bound serine protease (ClpP class)